MVAMLIHKHTAAICAANQRRGDVPCGWGGRVYSGLSWIGPLFLDLGMEWKVGQFDPAGLILV